MGSCIWLLHVCIAQEISGAVNARWRAQGERRERVRENEKESVCERDTGSGCGKKTRNTLWIVDSQLTEVKREVTKV